jgi:hypothetical protein
MGVRKYRKHPAQHRVFLMQQTSQDDILPLDSYGAACKTHRLLCRQAC